MGGDDTLLGGAGRDLLMGGAGADVLRGGGGEDLLVADWTSYDGNVAALDLLMREWSRADVPAATRRAHLQGTLGGGLNLGYQLTGATVHPDGAADKVTGGLGVDWFFALIGEITDRDRGGIEVIVRLS
jgi:Ca2+-binding RTX toxin-like protein